MLNKRISDNRGVHKAFLCTRGFNVGHPQLVGALGFKLTVGQVRAHIWRVAIGEHPLPCQKYRPSASAERLVHARVWPAGLKLGGNTDFLSHLRYWALLLEY